MESNSGKTLAWVFGILLVLVGGGLVYYYQFTKIPSLNDQISSLQNQVKDLQDQIASQKEETTTTTTPTTETTNWKLYGNIKHGYSMKLPSTYGMYNEEGIFSSTIDPKADWMLLTEKGTRSDKGITVNITKSTINDWLKQNYQGGSGTSWVPTDVMIGTNKDIKAKKVVPATGITYYPFSSAYLIQVGDELWTFEEGKNAHILPDVMATFYMQ